MVNKKRANPFHVLKPWVNCLLRACWHPQQFVQGQHYVTFMLDKLDVVYISVCNWGEVERLQEVMPSLCGFAKEQDATNAKKKCVSRMPQNFIFF
jgi:hypothetical protein